MNKDYVDYVKGLNIGNMQFEKVWLSSQLKTTDIMTRLKHRFNNDIIDKTCENAFDVLYLILFDIKLHFSETLVVVYIPTEIIRTLNINADTLSERITFTCFKKKHKSYWYEICDKECCDKIKLSNGKILKLWKSPYILEAVTNYDKNYRKEWKDGWLEYEGNEYGDTSPFYIIGSLEQ